VLFYKAVDVGEYGQLQYHLFMQQIRQHR